MHAIKKALFLVFLSVVVNGNLAFIEADDDVITTEDVTDNIMNPKVRDDPQPIIAKRSVQGECNDQLKFPEDQNIKTVNNNKIINIQTNPNMVTFCQPQKFSVKIPAPSHVNLYPVNVDLRRCFGSPYTIAQGCVATQKEKVKVYYFDATNGKTRMAEMWEHTACVSECVKKAVHCTALEKYNSNECECECRYNEKTYTCKDVKKHFSTSKCACVCKAIKTCPLYKEFNPNTCDCECSQCIRDMCAKKNLVLDTTKCRCSTT